MIGGVRARLASLTFAQTRVALLMIAVAATACLMPAQSDSYWHLRAGYDLARTGHVPLVEAYSHTARGAPWPNHEWLWQALSWACHRLGGMALLTVAGAALATAACAVAYGLMRARPSVNFVLALAGIPLASVVWALRPQVASLLLLVLLLRLLIDGRHLHLYLPPLFLLWANLHGAVALGGLVMVVATVVAWFHDRRLAGRLAILTVVCGALTAATPMGVHLWTFIGESMARSRQNQIMEWMPSYPRGPIEICFWVAALLLVGTAVARWRRLDAFGDRLIVAVALVMVLLAARAMRNIAPFCLVWMPAMSRLIGPGARLPGARPDNAADEEHPRLNLALVALMLAGAVFAMAVAWRVPLPRLGWQPIPAPAIEAIRRCGGPLYNRYNEGGYLIWFVPEVPVFIDSRQDPYPASLLTADIEAERTGQYRALFSRYGIRCAALPPVSPVSKHLAADGWRELYRDESWVVQAAP